MAAYLCRAGKRSRETELRLEEGGNDSKKQGRKRNTVDKHPESVPEGGADSQGLQSKGLEPSKKRKKALKKQELEEHSFIDPAASAEPQGPVRVDSSLMSRMSKKLSGSKFRWAFP